MSYALSDSERAALSQIQAYSDAPMMRRAQIILLSAAGLRTADIADAVELSVSQVRHWRREWRVRRMGIFPDDAQGTLAAEETTGIFEEAVEAVQAAVQAGAGEVERSEGEVAPEAAGSESEPAIQPGVESPRLPLELRETVGMSPDDAMVEAGRKVLLFHFERMLLNEPGSRAGDDIEAVHDMRVATRRMRSACRLFDPFFKSSAIKPFVRELRRIARTLGEVRDLDVSIDKAQTFMADNPDYDLEPLLINWRKRRNKARRNLIDELDSKRCARFVEAFHAFLVKPGKGAKALPAPDSAVPYRVRHIAPRLIYEYYEQLRAYGPVLDGAIDEAALQTLHALRIDFKRFRYALEFFEEVLGPEARHVIEETKVMQDHLGDLNDTRVAGESLRAFVDRHNQKYSGVPIFLRPNITGVIQYAIAKENEQQQLLDTFGAAWTAFNRDAVRRDLALAVSIL
jgi:CHAD domain-containing protein/transposase-like protein